MFMIRMDFFFKFLVLYIKQGFSVRIQEMSQEPFLHSMEKKSTFLPYHAKKNHSTLEVDTFKVMLLPSYLAHDFKSPLLDIEITIS